MNKQIACLFVTLGLAACSSKPVAVSNESRGEAKPATQASMEAKQVAAEQETPYVAEIDFDKGSSKLTPSAQLKLERMLSRIQTNQNIDSIKVISWADQEYPADNSRDLPAAQKDLAKNRNETVENFIEKINDGIEVDTLSMAERPSELAEFIGTENARIKESLENSGISLSGSSTAPSKANGQSKASKAIIMMKLKNAR